MKCFFTLMISTSVLLGVMTDCRGSTIPVSLSGLTNANLRSFSNGANYPIAPTTLDVGGVSFELVPNGATPNSLGIIFTPNGNSEFTINTDIFGATTIYTLINSAFGQFGATNGRIEFVGDDDAFVSFDLIQGDNIRDHFNGGFNNLINDPAIVTENFGGNVRLDRQTFILPPTFRDETLTEIRFIGTNAGNPQGRAFLAGISVAVIPEPSGLILSASGLGLVFVGLYRARHRRLS